MQENSGSALGNAFAGGAAAAEDASTLWSNPAGMSRLASPQVAAAVHLVTPSFKFRDEGSVAAAFQPFRGGTGGDAGSLAVIPNLYAVVPLNGQWSVGIGVNGPFGLVTEYDDNWLGRFQGIKSDIKTINVNPSLSWRVSNTFAVGVGVNWQRVDAELTSKFNYSAGLAQAAGVAVARGQFPAALVPTIIGLTPGLESNARVEGDDSAWGWNIGFLWDATPQTRAGAHYRSSIKYDVAANVNFDNPALPTLPPALAPGRRATRDRRQRRALERRRHVGHRAAGIANLSVFQWLNDRWDRMADAQLTRWSTLKESLKFVRTTGEVARRNAGELRRYLATFRGRDIQVERPVEVPRRRRVGPDAGQHDGPHAAPAGCGPRVARRGRAIQIQPQLEVDAGLAYIPMKSPDINQNNGSTAQYGLIKGNYDASVTIFSAQLTYTF